MTADDSVPLELQGGRLCYRATNTFDTCPGTMRSNSLKFNYDARTFTINLGL